MDEYISREAVEQVLRGIANGLSVGETEALKAKGLKALYKIQGAKEILNSVDNDLCFIPAADVQPVDRWISCKDKMPDDGVNVLIYTGNRMISLAWYDKDMGYFYICDSEYKYNSLDVTHWQPLPEPPKED